MMSKLGDDLVLEILIRLPHPRSALLCKAVCKRWSCLISSPCSSFNRRFIAHRESRNRIQPPPSLFLPSKDLQSILFSFLPVPGEARGDFAVLDSFKDLILCGFAESRDIDSELDRLYLVCNPFTKQWVALPLPPKKPKRFVGYVANLVCEPRVVDLGGDGGQLSSVYSEYRFRVVRMYQWNLSVKLDVFCSESGEWAKEALVLDAHFRLFPQHVVSYNGEMFWPYKNDGLDPVLLAAFNPFRLDVPPSAIDASALLKRPGRWNISVSEGALHVITLEGKAVLGCSRNALTVWRLEEDRKSWRKRYEVSLEVSKYPLGACLVLGVHPADPGIVFLEFLEGTILSCNLRRGELEFFAKLLVPRWMPFQPSVSCWPTPIPRYKDLQVMYNGSYNCLVQNSKATPSVTHW